MSDDVFEEDTLRAPAQRSTPSPTGYRDYIPPLETSARSQVDEDIPIHKVRYYNFIHLYYRPELYLCWQTNAGEAVSRQPV